MPSMIDGGGRAPVRSVRRTATPRKSVYKPVYKPKPKKAPFNFLTQAGGGRTTTKKKAPFNFLTEAGMGGYAKQKGLIKAPGGTIKDPWNWAGIAKAAAAKQAAASKAKSVKKVAAPRSAVKAPVRAVAPVAAPVVKAPVKAVVPPKAVTTAPVASTPTQKFTTVGGKAGSYGKYNRKRGSRGPRSGLSVTPEMLRRAAMQRAG